MQLSIQHTTMPCKIDTSFPLMQAIITVQYETLEMSLIRGKIKEDGKKPKPKIKKDKRSEKEELFSSKKVSSRCKYTLV